MSTALEAVPPTMVDVTTVNEPCRPGAWGSATNCATHEGQELDADGKCFWARRPGFFERVLQDSIQHDKPPVLLDPGLCDMSALMRAPSSGLLRLARALNVQPPRRQEGDDDRKVKERFARAILDAVALDRAKQPLAVVEHRPFGVATTFENVITRALAQVGLEKKLLALFEQHPLPDMVRVISLHQPFAGLVVAGLKTLETRTWPWPYEPGWLAIHAAKKVDKKAMQYFGKGGPGARHAGKVAPHWQPQGVVLGLVWVDGCRPLLAEDFDQAWFFEANRFAWILKHPLAFTTPIPMRGPQKFASIPRRVVMQALAA